MIHIDTHVALWLFDGRVDRLPDRSRRRLQGETPLLSPMAELELSFLHEIGRIAGSADVVVNELRRILGLAMSTAPFGQVIAHATDLHWTRDPFDRLIVANALADGADLITANSRIRAHLPTAVWD